jgi:hypothetical protein
VTTTANACAVPTVHSRPCRQCTAERSSTVISRRSQRHTA